MTTHSVAADDYTPRPEIPSAAVRARHEATRDAALASPELWHRLTVPPTPRTNAEWRAAEVRRGRGVWSPKGRWEARVAPIEGGFAVYVKPLPVPAAVTS